MTVKALKAEVMDTDPVEGNKRTKSGKSAAYISMMAGYSKALPSKVRSSTACVPGTKALVTSRLTPALTRKASLPLPFRRTKKRTLKRAAKSSEAEEQHVQSILQELEKIGSKYMLNDCTLFHI